jgi:uncharacterized pyridoxal phosphate-containing UPF0001 family protein
MNDRLTFEEIKARFPSEWVLIGDLQTDASLEIVEGTVLCHSTDRDEVDRTLLELRPSHFAVRYLGTMPENTALVL